MFESVKTDVFTRSVFLHKASGNLFYNDFDLDLGVVLEPSLLTYRFLVAPMAEILDKCDVTFQTGKMTRLASIPGGHC